MVYKVNPLSSFGENCELIVSDILFSKWLLGCAFHAPVTHAEDSPDLQDLDTGFSLTTSYQSYQLPIVNRSWSLFPSSLCADLHSKNETIKFAEVYHLQDGCVLSFHYC